MGKGGQGCEGGLSPSPCCIFSIWNLMTILHFKKLPELQYLDLGTDPLGPCQLKFKITDPTFPFLYSFQNCNFLDSQRCYQATVQICSKPEWAADQVEARQMVSSHPTQKLTSSGCSLTLRRGPLLEPEVSKTVKTPYVLCSYLRALQGSHKQLPVTELQRYARHSLGIILLNPPGQGYVLILQL